MNNTTTANKTSSARRPDLRRMVFTALMAALSIILSELTSFNIPLMPSFISFDFSDMPAVLASLTMGPVSGVAVCLIKNLEGLFTTSTGGVGELSNFILSSCLVLPAGLVARKTHKYGWVITGGICGALLMALVSIASNYFIVYPVYTKFMPLEGIIGAYQAILPSVDSLLECLVIFNVPFTFVKGLTAVAISVPLYKRLRPIFNSISSEG
ncbi:MAG: ECF transporter S component [Ruminococcaceae bacterium]|nr:ECF transporter S component [Oscillospiraceae bacterium]